MKKGDKKKQQKALARRSERKRELAQRNRRLAGPPAAILYARSYPLLGCWVQPSWREMGLAIVVVARRQPDSRVVWGNFLVDYYCLGVKNCFCNANAPQNVFMRDLLPKLLQGALPEPVSPSFAHEMIYGGIEYAARWGFKPHPDFDLAQNVLDPPQHHPQRGTITFGKDGKPFYIDGPDDDPQAIMQQLDRTAGPGNYHFMVSYGQRPGEFFEVDEEDDESLLGPPTTLYLPRR